MECPNCDASGGSIHSSDCLDAGYVGDKEPVKKNDAGKPDLSYLMDFSEFNIDLCRVFTHGERKYGRNNYEKHDDPNRLVAAALRHLMSWHNGEIIDPDSGIDHLAHATANLAIMHKTMSKRRLEDGNKQEK